MAGWRLHPARRTTRENPKWTLQCWRNAGLAPNFGRVVADSRFAVGRAAHIRPVGRPSLPPRAHSASEGSNSERFTSRERAKHVVRPRPTERGIARYHRSRGRFSSSRSRGPLPSRPRRCRPSHLGGGHNRADLIQYEVRAQTTPSLETLMYASSGLVYASCVPPRSCSATSARDGEGVLANVIFVTSRTGKLRLTRQSRPTGGGLASLDAGGCLPRRGSLSLSGAARLAA